MTIAPLTLDDVVRAVGGTLLPEGTDGRTVPVNGISTDSRTVAPGEVFFALRGERFDGHDFVARALDARAGAAVVTPAWHREHATMISRGATLLLVPDVLDALQQLAAFHRARFTLPVICITGSSGKTTTKDMVAAVLARKYRVLKTPGNLNSQIGVPQVLLQLESSHEVAVLELGMNHAGELARLTTMARPTIGVITNAGPVHLEYLGSVEGVARAKGELLDGLPEDGVVLLNADDPHVMAQRNRTRARVITFGRAETAEVRACEITARMTGTAFRLADGAAFHLRIAGRHHVADALVAVALGRLFGVGDEDIRSALAGLAPAAMRMAYRRIGPVHLIDDTYNANPDSVCAALQTLAGASSGRRIAVLGDMLELGTESASAHREVGRAAAGAADRLIALGEWAPATVEGARKAGMAEDTAVVCQTHREAVERVFRAAGAGDVILIKGSRGMRMEEVVSRIEAHYAPAPQGDAVEERIMEP